MGLNGGKMRLRLMGYNDYEFAPNEEKELMAYIKSASFTAHKELLEFATLTYRELAPTIYYSLVSGASYEKLETINYMPITKNDFYAYRRKTLAMIRDYLDAIEDKK